MFVKIARLGSTVVENVANSGDKIREILSDNDIAFNETDDITLNGRPTTLNAGAEAGADQIATIVVTPKVKGGVDEFFVKVGYAGGQISEALVQRGWTVAQAVAAVEFSANGKTITVDGNPANLEQLLTGNERLIMLTAQVKGGR